MMLPAYTSSDLVEKLGIHINTVYALIHRGILVGHKIGKDYRFTEEQIQNFLNRTLTKGSR